MPPPNPLNSRLKTQLKMAINRLKLIQEKDTAIAKNSRREMATLLSDGKEQSARIRVENIIRSDEYVELLELLELYCELLLARIGLLEGRECDAGLEQAVRTIIYTAPRTDVKELSNLRDIFVTKFGKEFAKEVLDNPEQYLQEKVLKKLTSDPPSEELVTLYLKEIARAYSVPFSKLSDDEEEEEEEDDDDDDDEDGGNVAEKADTHKEQSEKELVAEEPIAADPPKPTPKPAPKKTPSFKSTPTPAKKANKDLDELLKRFENLKRH